MASCRQIPECSASIADDGQAGGFQLMKQDLQTSVFPQNWSEKQKQSTILNNN